MAIFYFWTEMQAQYFTDDVFSKITIGSRVNDSQTETIFDC